MVRPKQVFNGGPCEIMLPGPRVTLCTDWSGELDRYLGWMRDPEVCRYLVKGGTHYDMSALEEFLEETLLASDCIFFRVIENHTGQHMGNFLFKDINLKTKECGLGLLIGDGSCRGKGYGLEATRVALIFSATILDISRVVFEVALNNRPAVNMYLALGCRPTDQPRNILSNSGLSMKSDVFEIKRETILSGCTP